LLNADHIVYRTVTFGQPYYDACGSTQDHANQLDAIAQEMKRDTGQNEVNIVGQRRIRCTCLLQIILLVMTLQTL
jgi:hypothetical protein